MRRRASIGVRRFRKDARGGFERARSVLRKEWWFKISFDHRQSGVYDRQRSVEQEHAGMVVRGERRGNQSARAVARRVRCVATSIRRRGERYHHTRVVRRNHVPSSFKLVPSGNSSRRRGVDDGFQGRPIRRIGRHHARHRVGFGGIQVRVPTQSLVRAQLSHALGKRRFVAHDSRALRNRSGRRAHDNVRGRRFSARRQTRASREFLRLRLRVFPLRGGRIARRE